MSLGIECLLADDIEHARQLATQLDQLNIERRKIEIQMSQQAHESLNTILISMGDLSELPVGLCFI